MAANFNRVILMGNLTRDPELKYTSNGTAVARLGLAVNRRYRGRDEQWQEETTFVDIDVWGRTAENCSKFLNKGRPVFIEGRLKLDQWQDRQGNNQSKLRVVGELVQFLGGGSGGGQGGSRSDSGPAQTSSSRVTEESEPFDIPDDEVPF